MKQKPTIGKIVITQGVNQSSDEQPAIITRVNATQQVGPQHADSVNLLVFADGGDVKFMAAVYLFEGRRAAEHYRQVDLSPIGNKPVVAFWPDHV